MRKRLTIAQAAEFTGFDESRLREAGLNEGLGVIIGMDFFFTEAELQSWLQRQGEAGAPSQPVARARAVSRADVS